VPASSETSSLDPQRRAALVAAKLRALVRDHFAADVDIPMSLPMGAAAADRSLGRAFVLAQNDPSRSLGAALAWAGQQGLAEVHLLVEDDAARLARRAGEFARPPSVWWVQGRDLYPVAPEPPPPSPEPDPRAVALAPRLVAAGVDVTVEHGVVSGEVLGLEIARVVVDDDSARIELGVGRHDREAFAALYGDLPTEEALSRVIGTVRAHRALGVPDHPLQRLAPERWLRHCVIASPALVDAIELVAAPGPTARPGVKERGPAFATGTDRNGQAVVVAFSVGVDLDLVPTAAEARLVLDPDARLVLAVPERDDHPATRALAKALAVPADVVPVPGEWRC
jgi:hypothetical protein